MPAKNWTKAEPIDVEREIRRLVDESEGELELQNCGDTVLVVDVEPQSEGEYIYKIDLVLRDVMHRMQKIAEKKDHWIEIKFECDGEGQVSECWDPDRAHRTREEQVLGSWDCVANSALAICRAFCQMSS